MSLDDIYRSEARFLQHLQIQAANIGTYKTELNATGDQITAITNNADNVEWLIETCNVVNDFKLTMFGIKKVAMGNDTSATVGAVPTLSISAPPHTPIMAGMIKYHRDLDQLFIKTKPSQACLEAMDLIGPESVIPDAPSVKPTLETHSAMIGGIFTVVVGNRQQSDQFEVMVAVAGTSDWHSMGSFTGKSVDLHYDTSGSPVQLQVRVQLRKGNAAYGQPSDIVMTTVNP